MDLAAETVLLKTEALCVSVRPFAHTSQMVTWITRDYGRITTAIKGAQRPKSGFVGRYDVGTTCEVVFYARDHRGVHYIREVTPLAFREGLRRTWRAGIAASYACDLTMRIAQPSLRNEALYATLEETLDGLERARPSEIPLILLWHECRTLVATGVAPDFTRCPACPPSPRADFSMEEGRLICAHRPTRHRRPPTSTMHEEVLSLFTQMAHEPLEALQTAARASTRQDALGRPEPFPGIFGLRRFLGLFLAEHLDLLPGPRRTALELLI